MRIVFMFVFVFSILLSHVESSQTKHKSYRDVAAQTQTEEKTNSLSEIRKQINLEGIFRIADGTVKRYRVVEKPSQIITFKNIEGDLYSKLSWQADYGFQRVKTNDIKNFKTIKEYTNITLNQAGDFSLNVTQAEGVLFLSQGSQRELELEEIN
ncbi:MAG: hypothetical protein JNM93_01615 [Bacteriovoracaceae bacterium]|nr:hypothetical protein [Bacteriovoracaceae bacterium]